MYKTQIHLNTYFKSAGVMRHLDLVHEVLLRRMTVYQWDAVELLM